MKKFISIVLLFALLLTCCSCGKKAGEGETQIVIRDEKDMTPEELYGHIDQTQAIGGVHKIWNAKGVQFMVV